MRIFRLVATPLLLLALLGLLLWGAAWGWRNLTAPLPTPEPTPCVTITTEIVTPADVSVRVYNAGFTSGLANRVKTHLTDAGFQVIKVDNSDDPVTAGVIVVGNEDNKAAVELVASHFAVVEMQFDDRVDGTIDVLLSSDWGEYGAEPKLEVSSGEQGTTCKPPSPSPSPSEASPAPSQP